MNRDTSEDLDDDTSETGDTPTISERIIARYPAHNWNVIDDDTLRLEAGDAYIEVGAYLVDDEDDAGEIRADLEINDAQGVTITKGEISFDDLPEAIGQALVALHATDLATIGEAFNVDFDAVPQWAVEAFVKQADEVSYGMDDLSYLKTYDADRYARRYVLAEHARHRQKWPADHDDEHNESPPALSEAAVWLLSSTEPGDTLPPGTPGWVAQLKTQITQQWPDPEGAHEVLCIKAASLLLAEIARCRRARMKKEADDRAAPTEEKTQP